MKNKKKIILGSIIGIMIGLLISTTYAIFSYNKLGNNQQLIAGDIYMHYNETNTLTLENALPSSTYDETKYFEFTIKGKNTNTKYNIVYDINLNYGDEIENKIRIQDRFLKFRLVEVVNNEETELLNNKSYLSIDNKRIYVSTINKETNSQVNKTYRLYCWIDKSVVIGNTDYSDYSMTDWNNVYGSVKVSVSGDFSEKEIQTEPYLVMKNLNGITDWTNIRENITSIEFHTDGVIPNDAITSFDVTDTTSAGEVKLYTIDDGLGNNTYKAIIVGDDVIYAPVDSSRLFRNMTQLVTFNSKNFKVDNVENMRTIFGGCNSLIDIESISNWNTSKVTNMGNMFQNCTNLSNIDSLAKFDTSNVNIMYVMFYNCSNLINVDALKNWNTLNVIDMQCMFQNCTNLTNVDGLINWNVSNVNNMLQMFVGCSNLTNINGLANWNTLSLNIMQNMFVECSSLTNIDALSNWDTSNVTDMAQLFYNCYNLKNVRGLENWNVEKVTNMSSIFRSCINLEEIDLSNWKTSSLTNIDNMFGMWNDDNTPRYDSKLKRIVLSEKFDTSKATAMNTLFANNTMIEDYSFLQYIDVSNASSLSQMFQSNYGLTNTDLNYISNWDVSNVTGQYGMDQMFRYCINITDASALNNWNINPSANFSRMFGGVPTHPEFTKVAGTWDSEGTFTPTV